MPVAYFNSGLITADADTLGRPLIPGIEPGGSRAGEAMKPALLIKQVHASFRRADMGVEDNWAHVYLKLSQEPDLDPGLILPVLNLGAQVEVLGAEGKGVGGPMIHKLDELFRGTVWAPAYLGIRVEFDVDWGGGLNVNLWLDYEVLMIPWMDWFILWEYLDNVVNNAQEW